MRISTLRPGLLVGLSTSLAGGNVRYIVADLEADHTTDEGTRRAKWETTRTVADPAEHERAVKVRGRCTTLIRSPCSASRFGLLCPESKRDELDSAIQEARALAEEFNASEAITRINVYAIVARIAEDDAEAIRAINSEMRDLLDGMETSLRNLDADAVRDAANRARTLGAMLTDSAKAEVQRAIDAARSVARRISKAGESASVTIDAATFAALRTARTAFLDIEETAPVMVDIQQSVRAVDLEPGDDDGAVVLSDIVLTGAFARSIDLDIAA